MIRNWLKLYLKSFWRTKFFSALNIVGLSIGIAAMLLSVLFWHHEKSYDQWNPYKKQVFELEGTSESYFKNWFPAPISSKLEKLPDLIEAYNFSYSFAKISSIETEGKKDFLYDIAEKQANFFEFFPFETLYGSAVDYKNNYKDALALDIEQAERLFGKGINPIGKTVVLEDGKILTVRFVYNIQGNSSVTFKGLTSYSTENQIAYNKEGNWGDHNYTLLIKLKEGIDVNTVQLKIRDIMYEDILEAYAKEKGVTIEEIKKEFQENMVINFNRLDTIHLNPVSGGLGGGPTASKVLNIMLFSAILLLGLAIINAINLALVNGFTRAKEIGIRKVVGSTKIQLFQQFIFESVLTVLTALLFAFVLVEVALPYFNLLINRTIRFDFTSLLVPILLLVSCMVLLLGILPSLFLLSFDTLNVLKGNYMRSKIGIRIRNGFLVLQFVIAFFFLSTAIFMNRQVDKILEEDLGFSGDQVVNIKFKIKDLTQRGAIYQNIESDLKKIVGVKAATVHSVYFGSGAVSNSNNVIGEASIQSNNFPVGYDFLKVFDSHLTKGRFFDRTLASDSINSVLVNEAFVREINLKDEVLGKELQWNGQSFKIIGVVKDLRVEGASKATVAATYFMPNSASWFYHLTETISVKIDSKNTQQTLKDLEQFWAQRIDSAYPMQYTFANDDFAQTYQKTIYQRTLFLILMGISVFIALFGLLSIVSFSIESRLKEIAIRKVLGANSSDLIAKLSFQFMLLSVLGFLISIYPVVYIMNLWLEDFVNRISISVWPFLISFFSLLFFSMALVLLKSWKATRINVLKHINYE